MKAKQACACARTHTHTRPLRTWSAAAEQGRSRRALYRKVFPFLPLRYVQLHGLKDRDEIRRRDFPLLLLVKEIEGLIELGQLLICKQLTLPGPATRAAGQSPRADPAQPPARGSRSHCSRPPPARTACRTRSRPNARSSALRAWCGSSARRARGKAGAPTMVPLAELNLRLLAFRCGLRCRWALPHTTAVLTRKEKRAVVAHTKL